MFTHAEVIVAAIHRGDAIGASNGSYMAQQSQAHGSAAWGLQDPVSQALCTGIVRTSGVDCEATSEVNAYCSKLQGLHTMLLAVLILCQHYDLHEGSITLACDNEKAIYLVTDRRL